MKASRSISAASRNKVQPLSEANGSMTIPGLIFFTLLMGVGGLAIDMQRVYGVHGQMQAFVDNVALAAAAELDGQSTALTRAFRAAQGDDPAISPLVKGPANSAKFATETTLTIQRITFYRAIGPDPGPFVSTPTADDDDLCTYTAPAFTPVCVGGETVASASADARFVEIVAAERTVSYIVLPIVNALSAMFGPGPLWGGPTPPSAPLEARLQLRATAGFKRAICNSVPMMVCNPNEATQGLGADFDLAAVRGKQFIVKLQDGWDPPNFGLLDTFPGNGANALAESLAKVNPGTICTEDEVLVRTGQVTGPVQQAMNTRFDWYTGSFNSVQNNPDYKPAPNVVKGFEGCGNNPTAATDSMPLPRDDCFMAAAPGKTGPCANFNGGDPRFGDGRWARQQYWEHNHPGVPQPVGYIDPLATNGGWSRYDTYRYELEHPEMVNIAMGEQGAPSCSNQAPDTHRDRDRRIMYMAVVNCVQNQAVIGHGPIPVKAYAKIFLTEPVGHTTWQNQSRTINGAALTWPNITPFDIAVEIVDVVKPNDESGHLHVYPVLYR